MVSYHVLIPLIQDTDFGIQGLTLYTLPSRIQFAGWTEENIKDYRGPTPDIVAGLAENVRAKLEATYCICEVRTVSETSP